MRRFLLMVALAAPAAALAQTPGMRRGYDLYRQKDYAACAKYFAQYATETNNAEAFADSAICYALNGEKDAAFAKLDEAVRHGYDDTPELEKDGDLASVRSDPRWRGITERANANFEKGLAGSNGELVRIGLDDQADRASGEIDWTVVAPRDEQRRKRVRRIIAAGDAHSARDFWSAAIVMQHGDGPDDFHMAHELALRAAALGDTNARWLAAAAEDRYLQCIGKPQIWGTQYRRVGNGPVTMDPFDETAVTDEERAKWNVPPLAEAKRRLAEANEH